MSDCLGINYSDYIKTMHYQYGFDEQIAILYLKLYLQVANDPSMRGKSEREIACEFNDNLDIVDFANGSTDRMISYSGDIISTRYDDQDFLSDIDPNNIQYKFEKSDSNFLKVQQEYNKAVMDGIIVPKSEFILNNGGIDQIRNNINYDVKSTLSAYIDGELVGEKRREQININSILMPL